MNDKTVENFDLNAVIIDSDESSRSLLKEVLNNYKISVAEEALDVSGGYNAVLKTHPSLTVLDLNPSAEAALDLASTILRQFPDTTLILTSSTTEPDVILKAMRMGAREFLKKPLLKSDISNALDSFMSKFNETEPHKSGKLISIFGVKGGVGVTSIAANLIVHFAQSSSSLLLDMNFQFGNAPLYLNLKPKFSIMDVVTNIDDLEPDSLKKSLAVHPSGAAFIGGPPLIEDLESLNRNSFNRVLTLLQGLFDVIVADLPASFDDHTMKVLDSSDTILVVFTPDIPSISNTMKCLDVFRKIGYSDEKIMLVANRYNSAGSIHMEEIRKSLPLPVSWKIPNQNFSVMIESINRGVPLKKLSPKSKTAGSIADMAMKLHASEIETQTPEKKRFKKLFLK